VDLFIVEDRAKRQRVYRERDVHKKRGDHDLLTASLFGIVIWHFVFLAVSLRVCLYYLDIIP
jgi:hypothetical protein